MSTVEKHPQESTSLTVSNIIFYVFVTTLVAYAVNFKRKRQRLEYLASKIPGPPALPIVGNGLAFIGNPEDVMGKIEMFMEKYEAPFKFWVGHELYIIVSKPEDLQIVLNNTKTLEKGPAYKFFLNTVGTGLFSAPVEKWRRNRKVITPAFNMNLMTHFIPVFREKNAILMNRLKKFENTGKTFDLWEYISGAALDIICQTAMGYNVRAQEEEESEFAAALTKIDGQYSKKLKVFLDILLELKDAGAHFTDADIRDEVITMMIGGSETSALTNCFCLTLLGMHPEIQDKVYDEIYSIFGDSDRPVEMEDLAKLTYMEQVLKETLRLFPVGPVFLRKVTEEIQIASYTLPKDCNVIIPPVNTHHNEKYYKNPKQFNPDNFTPEAIAARHKYSFIAFSGGARGCIGSKYAMLSMKVLISTLLRKFEVQTDVKMEDIKLKVDLLMRSVHGYPVRLVTRDRRPSHVRNSATVQVN
ncbi:cytochrome P450 4C1-like [Diaphorina citri]|uniref:Cytochrome P450 4C1-like n=1 Tax=Diaphorina citri TaxID=121845 RepID=A0A1S4EDV9_DIACI|nr:cytochrome P450 4C1-like [Diaphorina citri]